MPFQFEGFSTPNGTYVPDEVFDVLAPELSEAELRVLLYIIRRTFGFKKNADDISLKQMIDGITKKDGTVLDRGTGMSKSANWRGIKGLLDKGIIISQRNSSSEKGDLPTTYSLRFKKDDAKSGGKPHQHSPEPQDHSEPPTTTAPVQGMPESKYPVFSKRTPPSSSEEHPRVLEKNTQETVWQQTDNNLSNIRRQQAAENTSQTHSTQEPQQTTTAPATTVAGAFESLGSVLLRAKKPAERSGATSEEAREAIRAYLKDIAGRFNDQAPLESSVSRAYNLYEAANLPLGEFLSRLLEVTSSMRELQSKVTKRANGSKATMAYYFACLEDRLGLRKRSRGESTGKPLTTSRTRSAQAVEETTAQFSPHRTSSPRGEPGGNSPPPHTHFFARPVAQVGRSQSGQSSVDARSASAALP